MEIQQPRRILALGAPDSGVLHLLKDLTGSAPELTSDSTAGLLHEWKIETRYYNATVPIWIDEILNVSEWRTEFVKPEAKEVVTVLGAWIYCFRKPVREEHMETIKDSLKAIADVIETACGYSSDAVCLAVAMPQSTTPYLEKSAEEWEDICMEHGFEFIDAEAKGRNEFSEPVGVERAQEALRTNNWEGGAGLELDDEDEEGFMGSFAAEEAEMGMEFYDMKSAVHGIDDAEGGEDQVQELEQMMSRMHAIKEMSEGMPEAERKRFAAKAVNDLMKTL